MDLKKKGFLKHRNLLNFCRYHARYHVAVLLSVQLKVKFRLSTLTA